METVRELPGADGDVIALPGAELRFVAGWLAPTEADALFAHLLQQVPWENHRIWMFGRLVDSPRLSCWMGDAGTEYRYSGVRFAPRPWLPEVRTLCEQLRGLSGKPLNSVLLNRYRDGRDAMGWHSDDEPELGTEPVIASVSLGAERRFLLKRRDGLVERQHLVLTHGSLLLMAGRTQHEWLHCLPRTARPVGERINLTFRWIQASTR